MGINQISKLFAMLVASFFFIVGGTPYWNIARAASHREAPITALDNKADITDWFACVSYEEGREDTVTFILAVDPLLEPSNAPLPPLSPVIPPAITALDGPGSTGLSLRQFYTVEMVDGEGNVIVEAGGIFDDPPNNLLADGVNINDVPYQNVFPYVAFANSGRDSFHLNPGGDGCETTTTSGGGGCTIAGAGSNIGISNLAILLVPVLYVFGRRFVRSISKS